MKREIFTEEHDAFRDMVRAFIAKEVTPYHEQWERDGIVSRDVWLAAGRAGLLGIHLDEKYGGGGQPDYRFYVILNEELARVAFFGRAVHPLEEQLADRKAGVEDDGQVADVTQAEPGQAALAFHPPGQPRG